MKLSLSTPCLGRSGALLLVLATSACSTATPDGRLPPPKAGPGVTFVYPRDGQLDVPVATRVFAHFSDPIVESLDAGCTLTDGKPQGPFCLVGPEGLVPATVQLKGTTVSLEPIKSLSADATYQLYASPTLIADATNLGNGTLTTFHTRSARPIAAAAPHLLTLNDATADVWADGGTSLPFLDVSSVRLLFSEPLDETTVTPSSVTLLKVEGATRTPVDATLIAKGTHVTLDPEVDLDSNAHYVLHLGSELKDLDGAAFTAVELPLQPARAELADGGLSTQALAITPVVLSNAPGPDSVLAGIPVNTNVVHSPLLGSSSLSFLEGGLTAQLGDTVRFGGPIPMILRKGQRLDLSSLVFRYGGVLESGLQSGTIHMVLLSDAAGFLTRNPLHDASQVPDTKSPVYVELTIDVALYSTDTTGNTLLSQTVLGVHLIGTSDTDEDQLAVDQVASLELDTLGINTASIGLALRVRSGGQVKEQPPELPRLTSSMPAAGASDFAPDSLIELNFSAPLDPMHVRDGHEVVLTQGTTRLTTATKLDGSTLIIRPEQRLRDGTSYTLTLSGLSSMWGQALPTLAPLTFSTSPYVATEVAPMLTTLSVGPPCALVPALSADGGTTDGGVYCVGSLPGVAPYQPFVLASNLDLRVQFSQPMRTSTLVPGTSCGSGSLRIEHLSNGVCTGVVAGTTFAHDRALRFTPSHPWVVGEHYRLTLVGGADNTCSAGEICGLGGRPLNTDPLTGIAPGSGGGPDVVIDFTATPTTSESYQPFSSDPFTDTNDNGQVEAGEALVPTNRVAMEVASTSGIVTAASLNGDDCMPEREGHQSCAYLHGELPVLIGQTLDNCPIDSSGGVPTSANPCIEVRALPSVILNTSLSMNSTVLGLVPLKNLDTGLLVMRVMEEGAYSYGYIMKELGQADPQFVIKQTLTFDAPDLVILNGLAKHDLKSMPLTIVLKGPVTFRPDGRMDVQLHNVGDIMTTVTIGAAGLKGMVHLKIPDHGMLLTVAGPLLR